MNCWFDFRNGARNQTTTTIQTNSAILHSAPFICLIGLINLWLKIDEAIHCAKTFWLQSIPQIKPIHQTNSLITLIAGC